MKKILLFTILALLTVWLAGCSSVPETKAEAGRPLFEQMQKQSAEIVENGGLAAVGIGESQSLELALTKAKTRARTELAQMLEVKIEALQKDFMEETGTPGDSGVLEQFSSTAKLITSQQIAGSTARELNYETVGNTVIAFAVMVLDPKLIADQLAKDNELYTRFRATQAFEDLDKEIRDYEAYKAEQRNRMMAE